jgi:hypothetical protein
MVSLKAYVEKGDHVDAFCDCLCCKEVQEFYNKTFVLIFIMPMFENCFQNHLVWNCVRNQFTVVPTAQYFHLTSSMQYDCPVCWLS